MPNNLACTLLEHYCQKPDKASVIVISSGQPDYIITYAELYEKAVLYAQNLKQIGIKAGEIVILIHQQGQELIFAYWGTVLAGAIPSVMPFLTEKLQVDIYLKDLQTLFELIQPAAILTYPEFAETVLPQANALLDESKVITPQKLLKAEGAVKLEDLAGLSRDPKEIAILQHSSGTTGLKKGVALSHQSIFSQLRVYTESIGLNENDVIVSWLPLYHDMGLIACFLLPICYQIPLVLLSPFDWVRAPVKLFKAVSKYQGSLSWLPNFAFNFLTQKIRPSDMEGLDLSSWREVISCSEPVREDSLRQFTERFKSYGFDPNALSVSYAMAENVFAVTQTPPGQAPKIDWVEPDLLQTQKFARQCPVGAGIPFVSCGPALPSVQVRLFDGSFQELPERHVGEIIIRSDSLFTEYFRNPNATAEAFVDGWYLTGDLGYLAEGEIYVCGRKKDLIIVGGKNIYPQDIEYIALQVEGVHPGRAAAFGFVNPRTGTEEVVLLAESDYFDEEQRQTIADQIRDKVTKESAVTLRTVQIVDKDWLIKTSSGKVARNANRLKYLSQQNLII